MRLPVFTRTRRRAAWLAAFLALGTAAPAAADPLRIQFLTQVPEGQTPLLRLFIQEPVDAVTVELRGPDGQRVLATTGALSAGTQRDVELPAAAGKRHYEGTITLRQKGADRTVPVKVDAVVGATLRVDIDKTKVDVPGRQLEARVSRAPARVEITVHDATGGPPATAEQDLTGRGANEALTITWPATTGPAARIDLKFHDVDGFYAGVSLFPWSVYIPHEEIAFATGSAAIAPGETAKLDASYARIADALAKSRALGPVKLFIAGHTDTVGGDAYNLKLSQQRAQAIAGWFRKRGVRLPIFFEGFGERAPVVGTPDETAEAKNRRVDYILAIEEPQLKTTGFRASWKRVP